MSYPNAGNIRNLSDQIGLYSSLKHEYGAKNIHPVIDKAERDLNASLRNWYQNFNNTVRSYMIKKQTFTISGLVNRFTKQAGAVHRHV